MPNLDIIKTKIPDSVNTNKSAKDSLIPNDFACEISRLEIDEDTPKMNKILKIFDPITLPIAISFSFLIDATTEVTSSGSDVPTATMVNPTNVSDIPNDIAIFEALSTTIVPPPIIATKPTAEKKILIIKFSLLLVWLNGFLIFSNKIITNKAHTIDAITTFPSIANKPTTPKITLAIIVFIVNLLSMIFWVDESVWHFVYPLFGLISNVTSEPPFTIFDVASAVPFFIVNFIIYS